MWGLDVIQLKRLVLNSLKIHFLAVAPTHFLRLKMQNVAISLFSHWFIPLSSVLAQLAPNVKLRCGPVKKNMKKNSEKYRFFLLRLIFEYLKWKMWRFLCLITWVYALATFCVSLLQLDQQIWSPEHTLSSCVLSATPFKELGRFQLIVE